MTENEILTIKWKRTGLLDDIPLHLEGEFAMILEQETRKLLNVSSGKGLPNIWPQLRRDFEKKYL